MTVMQVTEPTVFELRISPKVEGVRLEPRGKKSRVSCRKNITSNKELNQSEYHFLDLSDYQDFVARIILNDFSIESL